MGPGENTHLGLGGTSPIFIRTPPEWPRHTAADKQSMRWFMLAQHAPPPLLATRHLASRGNLMQADGS